MTLPVCAYAVWAQTGAATLTAALIEAGHWKRARQAVEARLKSDPRDAQAHALLSKIKASFGDLDGSLAEAERAVTLDSRNAGFHAQYAEACGLLADKISITKTIGYVRCVKRETSAALALDSKNLDALLVEMMFRWKAPLLAGGDRSHARRIVEQIRTISPAWGFLAEARLLEGQSDDASLENALKKAVQADPNLIRARSELARFYLSRKKFDLAAREAQAMVSLDADSSAGYEVLAGVFAAQQRWPELEATIGRAESVAGDDLSPYYAAAEALVGIGQDFRRAERYLNRYLQVPPEGRRPSHAQARMLLARLFESEGRKSDAVRELQAALELQPDLEPARKALRRLNKS